MSYLYLKPTPPFQIYILDSPAAANCSSPKLQFKCSKSVFILVFIIYWPVKIFIIPTVEFFDLPAM